MPHNEPMMRVIALGDYDVAAATRRLLMRYRIAVISRSPNHLPIPYALLAPSAPALDG